MVSHSEIVTYAQCERKWLYRYLLRIDMGTPSPPLQLGNRVHTLLAAHYGGVDWQGMVLENPEMLQAASMVTEYIRHWEGRDYRDPVAVETEVATTVGELLNTDDSTKVVGIADLVVPAPSGVSIVDHKTTGNAINRWTSYKSQETKLQLLWYAGLWTHVTGQPVWSIEANVLTTKGQYERIKWVATENMIRREWERRLGWISRITDTHNLLTSNTDITWPPYLDNTVPMNLGQACRWCDYSPVCQATTPEQALHILQIGKKK